VVRLELVELSARIMTNTVSDATPLLQLQTWKDTTVAVSLALVELEVLMELMVEQLELRAFRHG
jgi:hypothetical protein